MFTLQIIQEMDWLSFEKLCYLIFQKREVKVRKTGPGPDAGIDLEVFKKNKKIIIQCKGGRQIVTITTVMAHFGLIMKMKHIDKLNMSGGIIMCANRLSSKAKQFAQSTNIATYNGDDIVKYLEQLPINTQKYFFDKIIIKGWNIPSCPKCEIKMVIRKNKAENIRFYGCPNFFSTIECTENMNFEFPNPVTL